MALPKRPVRRKRGGFVPLLLAGVLLLSASSALARDLSFEDRVKAQEAIERVYWSHRLWPAENGLAKPPLEAVLSRAQIRAKVDDYLKKSNAQEEIWGRPIGAAQLQ